MNSKTEFITDKKGLSLSDALNQAVAIQACCEDYTVMDVTTKNCYYNPDINGLQFTADGTRQVFPLTPHALSQLCGKLEIPVRYVTRCIDDGYPDLAAENINAWLDDYHKNFFFRTHGENIRGVLSDKYTTLDAPEVLDVCVDTFKKGYIVKGLFLDYERMHIRVIQNKMLNIDGEDLFAGVTIDSSDVGRKTLMVKYFIYKQVCKNGMCISENMGNIYTQRHVGISKDDFKTELAENLGRVPAITDAMIDAIKCAQGYDKSLVDFRTFEEEKQKRFVSRIRALTRLPEEGVAKVLETMYNSYSVSRWGLINSLTEVAQDYTLERRIEVENAAGKLLLQGNLLVA